MAVPKDIRFYLADAAPNVTIEIKDATGTVQTITKAGVKGTNPSVLWSDLGLPDGDYEFTVTAADALGNPVAASAYRGDDGGKAVIVGEGSTITLNNNGGEIVGKALSVLSQAITAIQNGNRNVDLTQAFADATSAVEAEEVSLANTQKQLGDKSAQLKKLMTHAEDRISEAEVGSREEAAIRLQAQQASYEVTLEAVANVLKMTKLSDLL